MENEKTWQIKVMIEQLGSLRGMLKSHEEQMQQLREDNNWLKEKLPAGKNAAAALPEVQRRLDERFHRQAVRRSRGSRTRGAALGSPEKSECFADKRREAPTCRRTDRRDHRLHDMA